MYLFLLNVEVCTVLLDMALTREQSEGIKCDFDIRTFLCVNLEGGPWIFFCVYFCFSIFDLLSSVSLRKVASSYSDKIFI